MTKNTSYYIHIYNDQKEDRTTQYNLKQTIKFAEYKLWDLTYQAVPFDAKIIKPYFKILCTTLTCIYVCTILYIL